MFNKKWEYGQLINSEDGWLFMTDEGENEIEEDKFIDILNTLGKDGWELVEVDEVVGFLFKR